MKFLIRWRRDPAERALGPVERRFARGAQSLADLIAPSALEVRRDHLRLDDQYLRTLVLTAYPRTVAPGWLAPLVDFDAPLALSRHVYPLDPPRTVGLLTGQLVRLHSSRLLDARGGRLADPEREVAYEDAERLRDALQRGEEKVFSVSLYALVHADAPDALRDLTHRVEHALAGMLAHVRSAVFEQDAGLRSCLPTGEDQLLAYRNLDTTSLATSFLFSSGSLAMPGGVLYGRARHNHAPVIVDAFDPSLENGNAVVFARSGAGKSYFTKLVALRSLLRGVDLLVVDPEDEYRALGLAVDGQRVRLASTSAQRLNPFDLPPPADDAEERDPLAERVAALIALLEVMLAEPGHPLGPAERAVLDRALYRAYAAAGIMPDARTHARPPPLMRDLLAALEAEPGAVAAGLAARLARYVSGSLGGLFAGPTNVALERRFVAFDVQGLEPEMRPLGIHLIASFVWNQVRRSRRPRLLIVDEAWTLMQYPEGGAFLAAMARRARKYFLGLVAISQDVGDFLGSAQGRTVLANAAIKLLLKQDPSSIDAVAAALHLSEEERRFLLAAEKGEGLLLARGTRVALRVVASPQEHRLATTQPRELAEMAAAGAALTPVGANRPTATVASGVAP